MAKYLKEAIDTLARLKNMIQVKIPLVVPVHSGLEIFDRQKKSLVLLYK